MVLSVQDTWLLTQNHQTGRFYQNNEPGDLVSYLGPAQPSFGCRSTQAFFVLSKGRMTEERTAAVESRVSQISSSPLSQSANFSTLGGTTALLEFGSLATWRVVSDHTGITRLVQQTDCCRAE